MYKKETRLLALLLALALLATSISLRPTQAAAASKTKVGDAYYTILSEKTAIVEYVKPTKKTCTTATIPSTVKIGKKTYKVTSIAANAFKGCYELKKVTIGKNVTKIGKKAFYGCKNLKTIKIKATKLTMKSIGSKAFGKVHASAVITVPHSKLVDYMEIFVLKDTGFKGKRQHVTVDSNGPLNVYNPSESQFQESHTGITMVKLESGNDKRIDGDTNIFTAGDSFEITSQYRLLPPVYGYWMKDSRKIENRSWVMCMDCREFYPNYMQMAMHAGAGMAKNGVDNCHSGHHLIGESGTASRGSLDTWYFVPDDDPCSVTLTYTLPEGISIKKDDIYVYRKGDIDMNEQQLPDIDLADVCTVDVSAGKITITFDDIKNPKMYMRFNVEEYLKDMGYYDGHTPKEGEPSIRETFFIRMNGTITNTIDTDSDIRCTMSYSYKGSGMDKTFSRSIHTAAMQVANTDADGNSLTGAEFDLYRTRYNYSGSIGTSDWELLTGGLHAGDVVKGLGMGSADWENEYRLVQTKAPDGCQLAQPYVFAVKIDTTSGKTIITAMDDDDNELPVENGVITVTVVNAGGETGNSSSSTPTKEGAADTASKDTSSSSSDGIPTGGSAADDRNKANTVLVSYYKDGVRHSYAIHKEDEIDSDGMLDTAKYVKSYATGGFADCKLEKLTVNGETVSSFPTKVPAGTEICYYYISK